MKRKMLFFICLILFIVSIAGVSASDDLNQTNDDVSDILSISQSNDEISVKDGGTFTDLQKKIDDASEGSTITLENDYKYDDDFNTEGIHIDKDLTINGNGHKIDALGKSRILYIDSSNVQLNNIEFYNGYTSSSGGAIYSRTYLNLDNCKFVNNSASSGGACYAQACNVYNSIFENNTAQDGSGGALDLGNMIIYGFTLYKIITNCTFTENSATTSGGAICSLDVSLIENCNFTDNYAINNGGAFYSWVLSDNVRDSYIWDSNFYHNTAYRGGAVYSINRLYITKSTYINNIADGAGGAIFGSRYVNVTQSVLDGNIIYGTDYPMDSKAIYCGGSSQKLDYNFWGTNNPNFEDLIHTSSDYTPDVIYKLNMNNSEEIRNENIYFYLSFDGDLSNYITKVRCSKGTFTPGTIEIVNNKGSFILNTPSSSIVEVLNNYGEVILSHNVEIVGVEINVPDVTKNYGGSERLEITLIDNDSPIANAQVNININDEDYTRTTDSNGKISMALNLNAGNYDATVTYQDISTVAKVIINQLTTTNTLSYTKNSHNSVTLTALITPATATGDVVFTVNGKDYTAKVNDGKATYSLSDLAIGDYDVKASYTGDINHKSSDSNSVKFTIEEVKFDVNAPDLTKYYKGPERFIVTVKEDNNPVIGKDVTINLNGATYTRTTNENGEASMAINLNSGEYKVTSEFEGIKVESTITVKSTVSGENITKIFRNGTQYYATFVDTQGKTLAENTAVEFNINGVFYTRYTNDKGVARMNINLNPGEYIITAKNPNSTEMYTNIITVLPSIIENYNLTKYYKNASQYSLRLLDDEGNPVKAGVEITLNINGVFYKRMSNATGYVNMNINLEPGEYIITADYNGLMASNTIKVLSVIETQNLDMKYKDGSKFNATILDGQGKPYPGQKVTFNINGVFYDRITNEYGVAGLAINLMAGEYIITTSYNGLNAANKVTISS